ncbi:MAG: substrate-binding domain-containing protein [Planctomycetota bacterium]
MNTAGKHSSKRVSQELADLLRDRIVSGGIRAGSFLPSVRELMREHGSASLTVQRALRVLQDEGLVASAPRQGYRVLAGANDPARGCPVTLLLSSWEEGGLDGNYLKGLAEELQAAADLRGWKISGKMAPLDGYGGIFRRIQADRSWSLILDLPVDGLMQRARESGMPVVVIDNCDRATRFDAVVQDDFGGGEQAADFLLDRGHRRIGWLGPTEGAWHRRERRAGALLALQEAGLDVARAAEVAPRSGDLYRAARKLLAGWKRPTGVLALWRRAGIALREVALEMGLVPGRDLDVVTWGTEEEFATEGKRSPESGGLATVLWSMRSMAETALARLAAQRESPGLPAARTGIPTRLAIPEETRAGKGPAQKDEA